MLNSISTFIFYLVFNFFPASEFCLPSLLLTSSNSSENGNLSENDNSSENSNLSENGDPGSDNSSEKDLDKRLDSILSDRQKLIDAQSNEESQEKKDALKDLQEKYPEKLVNAENKGEFLDAIDEELTSKLTRIKHEENIQDDDDIEHNSAEQVDDELQLVERAENGDPGAIQKLREKFPEFFDNESGNPTTSSAVKQIKNMLEEDFPGEMNNEEDIAAKLDEEHKKEIRQKNSHLTDDQFNQAWDSYNKGNKRKRDNDDDDDDDSRKGGPSGSSFGGSSGGPSAGGPSTGGPSTGGSSYSKDSSTINFVLEKNNCEWPPSIFEYGGDD